MPRRPRISTDGLASHHVLNRAVVPERPAGGSNDATNDTKGHE